MLFFNKKKKIRSLRECILEARKKGVAVGHFNISNLEGLWAIARTVKRLNVPVIIGVSEGERDFVGVKQAYALVKTFQDEGQEIYLNADHTYSIERVREVVDAGFDAAIFDGAKGSIEDNIKNTKACVDLARASGREVLVEAELGYIGQSSQVIDKLPDGYSLQNMTTPEQAKDFVSKTGVDLFAPAVGNVHGIVVTGNPALDIARIKAITEAIPNTPLVLHGGSGTTAADFQNAIKAGISVVHINTELRVAYREGLQKGLADNPHEVAPYKYVKPAIEAMEKVVEKNLRIFNFL